MPIRVTKGIQPKGITMKRFVVAALLATSSTFTFAADQQCLANKYDGYIDASLQWYQDLVDLTVTQYPDLKEVSQWFLEGRKHHLSLIHISEPTRR